MKKYSKKFVILIVFLIVTSYVLYNLVLRADDDNISRVLYEKSDNSGRVNHTSRIFCIILTSVNNLDTKAKTVAETWGKKCDTYKLISLIPDRLLHSNSSGSTGLNTTQTSVNETRYEVNDILQPPGLVNDTYGKLTDKVFLTFKYLYENYNDYDWYLKADDDTFVFVDNLRDFVSDKNASEPVTYGYDFKVIVKNGYHSGGGGYLLSNEALNRIGSTLSGNYSYCTNTGTEDVDVAKCLRRLNVLPGKSTDELGRERFHPLSIRSHYFGNFPDWIYSYASNQVKKGSECCSDSSISFHYMSVPEIVKLDKLLDKLASKHPNENILFKHILNEFFG